MLRRETTREMNMLCVGRYTHNDQMDDDTRSQVSATTAPAMVMPTSRLRDVIEILDTKQPSVLNLDACIPDGNAVILDYILEKIGPSVKTLSLRFNSIKDDGVVSLVDWLATNENLEMLYLMGTGISPAARQAIENAFKKHMLGHRTTNQGFTMIRVPPKPQGEEPPQEK
jgi:hypothetical protein